MSTPAVTPLKGLSSLVFLMTMVSCTSGPADPDDLPTVTGEFGEAPDVDFGDRTPPDTGGSTVVIDGEGEETTETDLLAVDQAAYEWASDGASAELFASHGSGRMEFVSLPELADQLPTAAEALTGETVGSRVLVAFPGAELLSTDEEPGTPDDTQAPLTGVLLYDIHERYPANTTVDTDEPNEEFDGGTDLPSVTANSGAKPQVSFPQGDPPKELDVQVLVEGEGEEVTEGANVVTQYHGLTWGSSDEFDSTWEYGGIPKEFEVANDSMIAGWLQGLDGQNAGSRVLLTIPPDLAYGELGNEAVDIPPNETLIYVIDLLAVHPTG